MKALRTLRPFAVALLLIGVLFYVVSLMDTDFHHPQDTLGAAIAIGAGCGLMVPLAMAKTSRALQISAGVLVFLGITALLAVPGF
ncbi:MAG: hypothetical protein Q3972_04515 [Corynebacterium sp.]|nr:hypothetical protein [Corynebacterium sp.]